jgi:hypothetical protein
MTKIVSQTFVNLVAPKARPKHELLFNKPPWTLPQKFDAKRRANFCSTKIFFIGEKLPKSSGITHMVTSNGGHPLHHHLRHSGRLSNSLFNRRTTKQTFTQWLQAFAL